MHKKFRLLLLAAALLTLAVRTTIPVLAQNPTGSIKGTITDQQGAVIQNATITVTNKATGTVRTATSGADGIYLVSTLLPGEYEVKIEADGFATQVAVLTVQVGSTTTGDGALRAGTKGEVVDVVAEAPIIDKQNFKIDGVVTRQKIEALPLNGRNFLQLALLEPGVSVTASDVGNANNLFNVSIGGASSALTRITVDGGSILDPVTGGAAQNFSTETIQEFQISTFSFDLSTGVTSVGAVNIVSRTGTNDVHGSGFLYFRDHSIAALPTFVRPSRSFDPDFRRYQYGGAIGGPIQKDKAFFFGNAEKLHQRSVLTFFNTGAPVFDQFTSTFNSPYDGLLLNVRTDLKLNEKHNMFVRYSWDNNDAFAPVGGNRLPSNWRVNQNDDHNIQFGLTTILRPNLVNDARFNYQRINNISDPPTAQDCPSTFIGCLNAGGAQINIGGLGSNTMGNHDQAPQARHLDRYQTRDDMNWQKGSHRIRFGFEWEHNYGKGLWDFFDPALIVLHDPRSVEATNIAFAASINAAPLPPALKPVLIAAFNIPLPPSLRTGSTLPISLDDILQLPFIAGAVGVGDPTQPPPFRTSIARQSNRYRGYLQDSWLVKPGFTFSFGASYQYETNLANHDLTRPELLRSIVGELGNAPKDKNNIAPSLGFAWDVKNDGKTVIRGGAGIYYDTVLFVTRLLERPLLGPAGDGRLSVPTAFFVNPFSFTPIPPGLGALTVIGRIINPPVGASLNFLNNAPGIGAGTLPTKFTGAQALAAFSAQVPTLQSNLAAGASQGFSSIQYVKSASLPGTLLDPNLESPYSEQFTVGFQRQLPSNMAISADFVLRKRVNEISGATGVGSAIDLNHFNRIAANGGPVLPKCSAAQSADPTAICSNGPIPVIQSIARSSYKALLMKLDKRFSNRYQFTASYALSSSRGFFLRGGLPEDQDDWFANPGPESNDSRHRFTFSGVANLPWGIQGSLIAVYASKGPFNARIPGDVDLNGDGVGGDTLPGLKINDLGRGTGSAELFQLVNQYNANIAKPSNGLIRPLVIAPDFRFGDAFHSQDLRFSKEIRFKERYAIQGLVEVFNVFNVSNLTGYSTGLDVANFTNPTTPGDLSITLPSTFRFGRPSARAGQAFGTGGPRAFQFGARFTF